MPSLKWGWDMVINEVQTLEVQTWAVEEKTPLVAEESIQPARRIVQFNSYPWWTETQQEERAIASNFLSTYVPNPQIFWPEASNYKNMASYRDAIESLNETTIDHAVNAALALASVDVLKDETPWEEALKKAMLQASELWEIGSLNVEVVGRKAQRNWAQAGAMYDQGALPEVRDKRGLVGDGAWVEKPWVNGQVAQLADLHKRARNHSPVALKVAWHVAQSNVAEQTWNAKWEDPALWDATSIRTDRFAEYPPSSRRPTAWPSRPRIWKKIHRQRCRRCACGWPFWNRLNRVRSCQKKRFWPWSGTGEAWQWKWPKWLDKETIPRWGRPQLCRQAQRSMRRARTPSMAARMNTLPLLSI